MTAPAPGKVPARQALSTDLELLTEADLKNYKAAFSDIQSFPLVGHPGNAMSLCFVRARREKGSEDPDPQSARDFAKLMREIADKLTDTMTGVDSRAEGAEVISAGLSASGYRALNIAYGKDLYAQSAQGSAFREGFQQRALQPAGGYAAQANVRRHPAFDAVIIVASKGQPVTAPPQGVVGPGKGGVVSKGKKLTIQFENDQDLIGKLRDIEKQLLGKAGAAVEVAHVDPFSSLIYGHLNSLDFVIQNGSRNAQGTDWFGFKDGISNPVFFQAHYDAILSKSAPLQKVANKGKHGSGKKNVQQTAPSWDPRARLSLVLAPELYPADANAEEFGSYLAFVKFKLNVPAFNALASRIADDLQIPLAEAMARIIGRRQDGTPLVDPHTGNNDFVYPSAPDNGNKAPAQCPMGAHIRKMNPRRSDSRGNRIVRRGIPCLDEDGQGLLFLSFQASLAQQFEKLFTVWANNRHFPEPDGDPDPITGNMAPNRALTVEANGETATAPILEPLTEVVFGDYFFMPSISFFRRLPDPNSESTKG